MKLHQTGTNGQRKLPGLVALWRTTQNGLTTFASSTSWWVHFRLSVSSELLRRHVLNLFTVFSLLDTVHGMGTGIVQSVQIQLSAAVLPYLLCRCTYKFYATNFNVDLRVRTKTSDFLVPFNRNWMRFGLHFSTGLVIYQAVDIPLLYILVTENIWLIFSVTRIQSHPYPEWLKVCLVCFGGDLTLTLL